MYLYFTNHVLRYLSQYQHFYCMIYSIIYWKYLLHFSFDADSLVITWFIKAYLENICYIIFVLAFRQTVWLLHASCLFRIAAIIAPNQICNSIGIHFRWQYLKMITHHSCLITIVTQNNFRLYQKNKCWWFNQSFRICTYNFTFTN